MTLLLTDQALIERLIAERKACDGDWYDEVWEGIYVMAPIANNEHQAVQFNLAATLKFALGWDVPVEIRTGVNVSDRDVGWEHNYRVPDVALVLPGGSVRQHENHWEGGPDFVVEIASRYDQTREKLPFYGQIGVRELLLVDRYPRALELYTLREGQLVLAGRAAPTAPAALPSGVLPVTFGLVEGASRPMIEVRQSAPGGQTWRI